MYAPVGCILTLLPGGVYVKESHGSGDLARVGLVPETGETGALSSIVNTRLLPALLGTEESVFSKR